MTDTDALRAALAKIQMSEQFRPLPLPWSVWSSCSFRRVGCDATGADGDVLHGIVDRHDGHHDLSMSEERLKAWVALTNALPSLLDRIAELEAALAPFALHIKPDVLGTKLIDTVAWTADQHRAALRALGGYPARLALNPKVG